MRKGGTVIIVGALALLLVAGVYEVFRLRFQAGDIYPEYSTLRADPLGAKAAFDTIEELGEHDQVVRYSQDLRLLKAGADSTLFFAGVTGSWVDERLSKTEFEVLDGAILEGARLVMTISGRDNAIGGEIEDEELGEVEILTPDEVLDQESGKGKQPNEEAGSEETSTEDAEETVVLGFGEVKERWGFAVGYASSEDWDVEEGIGAEVNVESPLLGDELTIRSPWRFTRLDSTWKPIASIEGRPVIMERRYGKGVIVLCADSWFLSNESLAKHRELGELLWAVGNRPTVIFDETHHGVQESEGVMGMVARYSLHGIVPGLVLLFLLVLWRGNTSLVPRNHSMESMAQRSNAVDGIDAGSGVVRLMRTGVSKQEILRQCYLAWIRNPVLRRRYSKSEIEGVRDRVVAEESKPSSKRNFVSAYAEIAQSLSRRSS